MGEGRRGAVELGLIGARLEAPITEAASRVAATAATALNSGRARDVSAILTRTMNAAIDDLAARHPQLREGRTRDYALAALSLKSTQAFATGEVNDVDLEAIVALPFLPLFLSPHQPAPIVTALELPYRVILSPIAPRTGGTRKRPSCTTTGANSGTRGYANRQRDRHGHGDERARHLVARLPARVAEILDPVRPPAAEAVPHDLWIRSIARCW